MAKKKELPKAMMGKVIKPVVRAMITGAKAAKKGYQETAAASKVAKAEKAAKATKKTKSNFFESNYNPNTTPNKKTTSNKPQVKDTTGFPYGKLAKGVAVGTAIIGATALANRKKRTAKD